MMVWFGRFDLVSFLKTLKVAKTSLELQNWNYYGPGQVGSVQVSQIVIIRLGLNLANKLYKTNFIKTNLV